MERRAVFAVAAFVLGTSAACGGSSGSAPGAPAAPPSPPSVSQPALSFTKIGAAPPQTVSLANFAGPVSVTVADPLIVSVSPATLPAGSGTLTVTAVAGGTTTIALSDGVNAPLTLAVTVNLCLPPVPVLVQTQPANKATNVSPSVGSIVFGLAKSQNWAPAIVEQFGVRLIAANGAVVNGSLVAPSQPPPNASPAVAASDDWYAASIPQLSAGTTYRVQIVNPSDTCLPPFVAGTFST
jgi:hypothetical protein